MTNRSEDPLMHQVRDQFSSWTPQAPVGVQQAVYAELGKSAFWRWSATSLNIWYLALLVGGAGLLLGVGWKTEPTSVAQPVQPLEQTSPVTWEAFYPEQTAPTHVAQEVLAVTPAQSPAYTYVKPQPTPALLMASLDNTPMHTLGPMLVQTAAITPTLNADLNYWGKVDIWDQLQDTDRDEIRLVFNVTVPEEE